MALVQFWGAPPWWQGERLFVLCSPDRAFRGSRGRVVSRSWAPRAAVTVCCGHHPGPELVLNCRGRARCPECASEAEAHISREGWREGPQNRGEGRRGGGWERDPRIRFHATPSGAASRKSTSVHINVHTEVGLEASGSGLPVTHGAVASGSRFESGSGVSVAK